MKIFFCYIFELRFAPNLSSFLFNYETWARIRALKKFLKKVDPEEKKKIIDVGGGSGRLELAIKRTDIHIYDHNSDSIKIASKYFPNTTVGSGTKINFDDNSFDYAISVHALEHIPENERELFLMELIRISKDGVYLNFPEGEYAELVCENYLKALECNGKEPNKWTVEHLEMGLPQKEIIESILTKQNKFHFSFKHIKNYKAENFYWTKVNASNKLLGKYLVSPFVSLYRHLFMYKKPTAELVVYGMKKKN